MGTSVNKKLKEMPTQYVHLFLISHFLNIYTSFLCNTFVQKSYILLAIEIH